MSVSIKDLAEKAGVSPSTVSRALKNHPRIGEDTRQAIQALAQELGYVPSEAARALVGQAAPAIGVALPDFRDPFYMGMLAGIEEIAIQEQHDLFIGGFNRDPGRERKLFDAFEEKRLAGIVVAGSLVDDAYLSRARRRLPAVLVNHCEYPAAVAIDQTLGMKQAVAHLADLGHERIAYVTLGQRSSSNTLRQRGYEQGLAEAKLPRDEQLIVPGNGGMAGGEQAVTQLLALSELPTAVVCYNDRTAIGVIQALDQRGLQVPEDISVIGFDDLEIAAFYVPSLTTVRQPDMELGRRAARMLFDQIQGHPVKVETLAPELVVRSSTGPNNCLRRKDV